METAVLPSQEFTSSQPECEVSMAGLHPEYVAATTELPRETQGRTPVIFAMELPTSSLENCASGHLGLRTSRHTPCVRLVKRCSEPLATKHGEASTMNLSGRV
ncbi:hypothetical protein MRX96_014224 [Rhipicephalus microplus]